MGLQGEVFQFPLSELLSDGAAMARAVKIKTQNICFTTLPLAGLRRLFMTTGAPMPALALDLLTQILLELQSQPRLTSAETFSHALEIVGSDGALGQFAQQCHQLADRLLELIRAAQITFRQNLFDLPVKPQGRLIEQRPVITRAMGFQKVVGVLAGGQMQNAQ